MTNHAKTPKTPKPVTKNKKGRTDNTSVDSSGDKCKCKKCQVDLASDSKCIQCERCLLWYCIGCANITEAQYSAMSSLKFIHWFCLECEPAALKAAQNDKQVEEQCKEFFSVYDTRLTKCEENIEKKAEKSEVDSLKATVINQDDRIEGLLKDISTLNRKLDLVRFEPFEKAKRKNNIVIRGLPETGNSDEDKAKVAVALAEVGCAAIIPNDVARLGELKKKETVVEGADASPLPSDFIPRPIRCTLSSTDEKAQILKNGKKIRNSKSDLFDPKKIFFVPDQTALERADDVKLREQLRLKRIEFPDKSFMIKNRKVIDITATEPGLRSRRNSSPSDRRSGSGSRTFRSQTMSHN